MSRFQVEDVLPPDRIPSVDDPEYATEYEGDADDDVIVVTLGDDARAYPVRYLHFHEIVNDEVGGVPVAVTWCPLCASAVVYDRRVAVDGEEVTLEFGVSGTLADDDLVMYDRRTESHWKQSLGTAIDGPLEGTELTVVSGPVTTWESFRETHPGGKVLAPPGGVSEAASDDDDPVPIEYDENPYESYWAGDSFGLAARRGDGSREWSRSDLHPKATVLGVKHGGDAVGFARPVVVGGDARETTSGAGASDGDGEGRGVVTATVGGLSVVVFATEAGMNAFEDPGYEWAVATTAFRAYTDQEESLYDGTTGQLVGADTAAEGEAVSTRRALERVPAQRLFAFTWQDDNGPDAFYAL